MSVMIGSLAFLLAAVCAGLMGYAVQSGATCTVYAVFELVEKRRPARLVAMLEAGLWVAFVLVVAGALGWGPRAPAGFVPGAATVVGGVLLGLGAYVNGACVFGSVARFGSGEIGYAATPVGYLLGVFLCERLAPGMAAPVAGRAGWLVPPLLALGFGAYAGLRSLRTIYWTLRRADGDGRPHLWAPHEATLVIGVTFAVLMLAAGRWSWPELLADLARGEVAGAGWRMLLFVVLLAGARLGGVRHGRRVWLRPGAARIAACLAGGVMMGAGGALIPGGNDGLVLIGLPFLMPHALLALATMAATTALAIGAQRWLVRPGSGPQAA